MKILTLAIIGSLLIHCSIFSQQTVDHILAEIEHNNTSLSALRKSMDAEKTGNKTGIYIQNPEIEFNYLWGSPSIIGKRTDFKLTQSIDFPSAYGHRSKISDIKNEQVNYTYKQELQRLRLESRLLCYDLIFANALSAELSKRLVHAQGIADAFQSQYDLGETNVLEYNKSQLNLLNLNNKLETVNIERSALLSELARLNGGNPVVLEDTVFQLAAIPVDFEQWFHNAQQYNHILNWLGQEIEINRKEKQLNTALSLPKLSAGYMSEKVIGNQFQGITLGLSIP